ncbi:unnamed protein product [Polarella glacialis]|uniref:Uncharacterized protein n=1 Tax=Polarella glacialis TaxID=89957 RepID=A0A813F322_POLGL|nr:unnamed protein product [Polarella glacialis]
MCWRASPSWSAYCSMSNVVVRRTSIPTCTRQNAAENFQPSLFAEAVCDLTALAKQDHVCVVFLYSGHEIRGKRGLVAMKLVEACVHPANVVPCEHSDHGRLCKPSQCKALQHFVQAFSMEGFAARR